MTLSSWLELNYNHVTLEQNIVQDGKRLVCKPFCVELTMALLSTDNVADWAKVALHFAPAGTIIDKVPIDYYDTKVLLVHQLLTKQLVQNPDNKMAQRFLSILERRDADRWAQKKNALSLKATATDSGKDGSNGEKKITFDFEIVKA